MNRDPNNFECTRDPIFLLQVGTRIWNDIPEGCSFEDEALIVTDPERVADWLRPFVEDGVVIESDSLWFAAESEETAFDLPWVRTEWETRSVFLTRPEAEEYAKARSHHYKQWKVYCIPCDGELARILNEYERPSGDGASGEIPDGLTGALDIYGAAHNFADRIRRQTFAINERVLSVQGTAFIPATVSAFPADPRYLSLLFENGNVWDKPISAIRKCSTDAH